MLPWDLASPRPRHARATTYTLQLLRYSLAIGQATCLAAAQVSEGAVQELPTTHTLQVPPLLLQLCFLPLRRCLRAALGSASMGRKWKTHSVMHNAVVHTLRCSSS